MNFSNLKILVLGDVCLDVTQEGPSYRLSPEAPVPVILNPVESYNLGMAANVVSNAKNLGAEVDFVFFLGDDEYGEIISNLLEARTTHIADDNYKTIVKKRILANGQQVARLDFEDKLDEKIIIDNLKKSLLGMIEEGIFYDSIIISDYNKGYITENTWSEIKPLLLKLSNSFFVDTKKLNVLDFYKNMYLFPNRKEMNDILAHYQCSSKHLLLYYLQSNFIIETLSEEGAIVYTEDGSQKEKALASQIADVSGAGDTFIASFTLAYAKGYNYAESLKFANYCCSKVVQKKGTTPILLSEVDDFDFESI